MRNTLRKVVAVLIPSAAIVGCLVGLLTLLFGDDICQRITQRECLKVVRDWYQEQEMARPQKSKADGMITLYVPAGSFTMGSNTASDPNEKPEHQVTLSAFRIDQTEVTNAMFRRFVDHQKAEYKTQAELQGGGFCYDVTAKDHLWVSGANWRQPQGSSDQQNLDGHPVVQVTWEEASAYCNWAGRRLPTEAEWEKAARGTDGRLYPWDKRASSGLRLNAADSPGQTDIFARTAPVGSFNKGVSPFGALDMAGNVWEWVADWYEKDYYSKPAIENPRGAASGTVRVLRGGGWNRSLDSARTTIRAFNNLKWSSDTIGFRCAMDIPLAEPAR